MLDILQRLHVDLVELLGGRQPILDLVCCLEGEVLILLAVEGCEFMKWLLDVVVSPDLYLPRGVFYFDFEFLLASKMVRLGVWLLREGFWLVLGVYLVILLRHAPL